jgi:hypothetical protein
MAEEGLSFGDRILEHLVGMAKTPGWKAYAWTAAKRYEEINPQDCKDMQQRLKQEMLKEKEGQQ